MSDRRAETGRRGEEVAAEHLVRQGFSIVARNARAGRLELDVIARRGRLLIVCEVRARMHGRFVSPAETVDARKIARLRRAAGAWLAEQGLHGIDVRFDVASVTFDGPGGSPQMEYYEDAF